MHTLTETTFHGRRARAWRQAAALLGLAASLLLPLAVRAADADFLEPDQAFQVRVEAQAPSASSPSESTLDIALVSAPGYHLYRERFSLQDGPAGLPAPQLPAGRLVFDTNFGRDMALWEGTVHVRQAIPASVREGTLQLSYQGCAEQGLCYPPQHGQLHFSRTADGRLQAQWQAPQADADLGGATLPVTAAAATSATPAAEAAPTPAVPADRSAAALASGSLWKVAGIFLLGGLLLSFTPCVLPMLPILSSIIVGQGQGVSRGRGLGLALAYSLGMALVYTVAGVVAGLLGSGFAAALQNPWVLGSFALLLSALALSMFGVWEFQMPSFIQQRVNNASNQLNGGRYLAVFGMGGLSALLVGPCVAAPLAGALVYISQTRDVLLGGVALFSLAAGMSVPLLLLGLSAGSLLPRAGRWMEHVKTFFGVLLLAVALWLVSPVLPIKVVMLLAGAGTLVLLFALGAFEAGRAGLARGVAAVLGLWAVAVLAGGLSGGDSLVQPLAHLARAGVAPAVAGPSAAGAAGAVEARFQRITTVAELDAALRSAGRPVMLDFYADWCVACKEMAHLTFSDPAVQGRLDKALLLQADVTADSAEAKALLKRFGLFGPPAVLFFNAQGQESAAARTIGYEAPDTFARRLDAAQL